MLATNNEPLAIVGIGCLFPAGGTTPAAFWANLYSGVDAIREVPPSHWRAEDYHDTDPRAPDRVYTVRGGFLDPVPFNPAAFGIPPTSLEATDTSQLLGLVAAQNALLDAGYHVGSAEEANKKGLRPLDRRKVSVLLGVTGTLELVVPLGARLGHPRWKQALREAGVDDVTAQDVIDRIGDSYVPWQENSFPGLLGNVVAGRIANKLDLGGTNCVVDAACASSLSALHLAALELQSGKADVVLSGGVDTFNDIFMYMCFSKTPALSPTGDSRPFDAQGDGTILGEGLGLVVLKRLADARAAGDRVYAVLRGIGTSSDGRGGAVYAPRAEGQVAALRDAYEQAGVGPETIELVEAHGTGTRVGDATEVQALSQVYGEANRQGRWCALGSIKSQLGHTKAAAGAAGLIKAALALHHKVLPPTIKVRQPLEILEREESPFYLNTAPRPWLPAKEHPRRAAVSAFGFGGSNFHAVLEEAGPDKPAADWDDGRVQIVALCGDSPAAITAQLSGLESLDGVALRTRAAESRAKFRSDAAHRLTLVIVVGVTDMPKLLASVRERLGASGSAWRLPDGSATYAVGVRAPLAILFSGQGAQYPGMLRDLVCRFPEALTELTHAEAAYQASANRSLAERIYPLVSFTPEQRSANEDQLRATDVAQPALGAVSLAAYRVLGGCGLQADALAGHSFGELTALCAAGCISVADFHRLAVLRGRCMAEAAAGTAGGMLAVHAAPEAITPVLERAGISLTLANKNAPEQTVLSGAVTEIQRAEEALTTARLRCQRLPVGGAFHSPLIASASLPFTEAVQGTAWQTGKVAVWANTTAAVYPAEADTARGLLGKQLANPVEFVRQIRAMHEAGLRDFLEIGPGGRLIGMVTRILDGQPHEAFALDASRGKQSGLHDLACAVAWLAARGQAIDLTTWDADWKPPLVEKKPALVVPLTGANYVAPRTPRPPRAQTPVAPVPVTTPAAPEPAKASSASVPVKAPVTPVPVKAQGATTPAPAPAPVSVPVPSPSPAPVRQAAMNVPTPPRVVDHPATSATVQAAREGMSILLQMQEQTARLHKQFLEGQEATQRSIQLLLGQQGAGSVTTPVLASPAASVRAPAPIPVPAPALASRPVVVSPAPIPAAAPVVPPVTRQPAPTPAPIPTPVVTPTPVPAAPNRIVGVLLEVVAEKTGYPTEMLELDMTLDGDLGIDSIKRVEILSALQERVPDAPAVKPEHLGTLQTLRQIIDHLGVTDGSLPAISVATPQADGRVVPILLEVVAEKTGYPTEMLELDMSLDADLGIDSIKRVEILSAIQERLPELPAVKPEHLGTLQTLRQIVEHLGVTTPNTAPATATAAIPSAPAGDLAPALLEVVAEKTGYPTEMLELDMSLEADLGIDSIKRVEILSALQERVPDAPAVEPQHLGTLQTLRQIVEHLAGATTALPVKPTAAIAPTPKAATGLQRSVLRRVALAPASTRASLRLPEGEFLLSGDDELTPALAERLKVMGRRVRVLPLERLPHEQLPDRAALVIIAPRSGIDGEFLSNALFAVQQQGRTAGLLATVARLDGAFGLTSLDPERSPVDGGLAGLTKTVGQEWDRITARAFDVAGDVPTETAAVWLVEELLRSGPVETGLDVRGAGAMELVSEPQPPAGPLPLQAGDVVVVSGGARGVTAEVAVALARAAQPTLVLLGRSELTEEPADLHPLISEADLKRALIARQPGTSPRAISEEVARILARREVRQTLARITATGARAVYRAVDVSDAPAVAKTLGEIRTTLGPIRGLIHGAGVLADAKIEDKTPAQVSAVFGPKIDGLAHLLASCDHDALRAIVLFSSTTARLGRRGQVDYAMANEVLNKEAGRLVAAMPQCRVLSIGWGPWEGGMVSPALRKLFESEGVGLIPLETGANWLVAELASKGPVEVVVLAGGSPGSGNLTVAGSATRLEAHGADASRSPGVDLSPAFTRRIDVDSHPVLVGHVLDHRPVLPLALTLEYVGHAALHVNPGLHFHGCNDLRVLHGITLEHGPRTIELFAGKARKVDGLFLAPVELRSQNDDGRVVLHARSEVVLTSHLPVAPAQAATPTLPPYPHSTDTIYEELLFHGPELVAIERVEGCGPAGITARLRPAPLPSVWITQPLRPRWLADPLVLDGVFQLMILWSRQQHQSPSLPCRVGKYRQYRRAFPGEPVRAVLRIVKQMAAQAVMEVELTTLPGELIGRLEEVEIVLDPALQGAFSRNRLPAGRV